MNDCFTLSFVVVVAAVVAAIVVAIVGGGVVVVLTLTLRRRSPRSHNGPGTLGRSEKPFLKKSEFGCLKIHETKKAHTR